MESLRVACVSLNQTALDWDGNYARIVAALDAARAAGARLACLPELAISGYGAEDMFHAPYVAEYSLQILHELLSASAGLVTCIGLPIVLEGVVYNAAALLVDGRLRAVVPKSFLAGDGVHYEQRWFKPWPVAKVASAKFFGEMVPVGSVILDCAGLRLGLEICEDAWVANPPSTALSQYGAQIILNPSASHFAFGKHLVRERIVTEASRARACAYLYANLLGCESGRVIYDGDCVIAQAGSVLARAQRFCFAPWTILTADLDLAAVQLARTRSISFVPQDAPDARVHLCNFSLLTNGVSRCASSTMQLSPVQPHKHEEFACAVALGLFDYMRKSAAHGFTLSLSGGADSAAVACLVRIMLARACAELGVEGFKKALGYYNELAPCATEPELMQRLLCTVYQATAQSGAVTRQAALALAQALHCAHMQVELEQVVAKYIDLAQQASGTQLSWSSHDFPLQNIQARARAPMVWLLANLRNSLLLCTSNRSEAAVGYTTMDGDSAGGLCPIGGVDKAYIREWLRWLEQQGCAPLGPIPALVAVNAQAPTAELRPPSAGQTDEKDLMPYELLQEIERLAVPHKKSPAEVFEQLPAALQQRYASEQLKNYISKFFQLWARSQWKRERMAPSFHLDDYNLDPKTWCRFPILSGGAVLSGAAMRELRELRGFTGNYTPTK